MRLDLERLDIAPGLYHLDVGLYGPEWTEVLDYLWEVRTIELVGDPTNGPVAPPDVGEDHPLSDGEQAWAGERGHPDQEPAAAASAPLRDGLAQRGVELDVVVVDDGSGPGVTASAAALGDPRNVEPLETTSREAWRPARNRGWTTRAVTGSRSL